jgi:hypothetical protein
MTIKSVRWSWWLLGSRTGRSDCGWALARTPMLNIVKRHRAKQAAITG